MTRNSFINEAMNENHQDFQKAIARVDTIKKRSTDIRTEFGRDYTRIIFCQGYRRLKHKTQVFFAPDNDHVCTRIEHVNLVESVSNTIASYLGLNTELTKAIAVGHDLGHAPFGHGGEHIIQSIASEYKLERFFHERNSLHFIDSIETLQNDETKRENLSLTYAVRDGIICHCGEVNQKHITKRNEYIDLNQYTHPGQYAPYTWEGCVVKMSDKIAYLARDIEDALRLNIITKDQVEVLRNELNTICNNETFLAINNGTIVNYFILDVCNQSNPKEGISLSDEALTIMKHIMKFNYQNIYLIHRVEVHKKYVELMLKSIFELLLNYQIDASQQNISLLQRLQQDEKLYPKTISSYIHWLEKYALFPNQPRNELYQNKVVYNFIDDSLAMQKSIIDYLSGMSDVFIIQIFEELLRF